MQRDPFWTPDPWKTQDPWEVKDPFGVDLKAERQRARQARENRQLQPAERAQPTTEAAARDEQRQQLRAQQATDALTVQAAAIEAERQRGRFGIRVKSGHKADDRGARGVW